MRASLHQRYQFTANATILPFAACRSFTPVNLIQLGEKLKIWVDSPDIADDRMEV
jgi:hypothetical protein